MRLVGSASRRFSVGRLAKPAGDSGSSLATYMQDGAV